MAKAKAAAPAKTPRVKGARAKAVGQAAAKTARVTGMVVLPAVPVTRDIIKNRHNIKAAAAGHMKALRMGEAGAKISALKSFGKALGPASTYIFPALASAAAISTAREAYRMRGRIDEAIEEGAYAGVDLLLGNALSEYARSREKGETKASAVAIATLKGLDNRLLFGMGQKAFNAERGRTPEQRDKVWRDTSEFGQESDFSPGEYTGGETPIPPTEPAPNQPDPTTMNLSRAQGVPSGHGPGYGPHVRMSSNVEDRREWPQGPTDMLVGGPFEKRNFVDEAFERKQASFNLTNKIVGAAKSGAWQRASDYLENGTFDLFPNANRNLETYHAAMAKHRNAVHSRATAGIRDQGLKDLSQMSRPQGTGRLDFAQQAEFAKRDQAYRRHQAPSKGRNAAPSQRYGSGEGKRGFANPAVQKAAQEARGVQNITNWAKDAEPGSKKR